MQISTVIAALAAAGGLVFAGWTSYYSVQTARDQLSQSREDTDRELRRQALLVSTWTQIDGSDAPRGEPGKTTGFIMHRSLDPVDQVVVGIATEPEPDEKAHNFMLELGALPPCSRVTIPAHTVTFTLGVRVELNYKIVGVSLVDVQGQRWTRISSGALQRITKAPEGKDASIHHQMAITRALFGGKDADAVMNAVPGAGSSPLGAPESLQDCGVDA
ncbi:hypothetical protein [Streptomyces sp. NPDC018693]|uniref:hypothetical protein n=1 Tax=unclassified Streptomyces TaxID=2593676 RepID=UPI00379A23A6